MIGELQFKSYHAVVHLMVEIWLPYGVSEVPVRIPDENLIDILQPRPSEQPSVVDLDKIVSDELVTIAKNSSRVCIVVGESRNKELITNATKSLANRFAREGIPASSLTILRTPKSDAIVGLAPEVQVVHHSPENSVTIPCEGYSSDFIPSLNSLVTENVLTIAVGELRPNHFIGFSGLCDTIFPGLASEKSAYDQLVRSKPLDPHDLYKERLEVTSNLHNVYGLGFVLNSELSPIEVGLGKFDETVGKLSETLRRVATIQASKSADIVVMSVGGMPLDESLLTAVESFPAGLSVLKRNGALIVAAECSLGHGNTDFYAWVKEHKEARHLEARLRHRFNYNGWKAAYLLRVLNSHRVYLVSTIPDHHLEHTFGLKPAKTMNGALQSAQRALGADASISVIPNAGHVIPSIPTSTGISKTELS